LDVYKVQGTTKEEFVANAIHVEIQHHHLYTTHHVARATNATNTYQTKHDIVIYDMI
jgi:hypothetical protein